MKVILSVDPIKFPLTGIGRYTRELALGLQRRGLGDLCFLKGHRLVRELPTLGTSDPMRGSSVFKGVIGRNPAAMRVFRAANSFLKGRALKGFEEHLFHGPNYYLPPFGGRSVVTIHDLSHYKWSNAHPPERVQLLQAETELTLKRASLIITDAEFTKKEVAEYFSWPAERIKVVPLAAGPEFFPRTREDASSTLRGLGLEAGAYSLCTGTIEPRKNLQSLLDAYSRLPAATRLRFPLVVAGFRGWQSEKLHKRLVEAQREGWVRYLGFVPNEVLPILTAGAHLFVYPSFYEGFGLPVLEAMASGVPVVCSNASTLPEVSGGAAALHDPNDTDGLLACLCMGLEDSGWRATARVAGLRQAERFSWDRCTAETMAAYEAALAQ